MLFGHKMVHSSRPGLDRIGPPPGASRRHTFISFPKNYSRKKRNKNLSKEDIDRINSFDQKHGITKNRAVSTDEHLEYLKFRKRSALSRGARSRYIPITLPKLKCLELPAEE